ncbi:hypothetical protein Pint_15496 [Pistacia integerrima]|uniref:Uncharacterized protein n=1 Tax=Pistacia integerrima TaxID=434235 RepID=A0ACC0ZCA1_9ROSI|nr:hypothetical protein Pint_15496 [Pistacia integerrima]
MLQWQNFALWRLSERNILLKQCCQSVSKTDCIIPVYFRNASMINFDVTMSLLMSQH